MKAQEEVKEKKDALLRRAHSAHHRGAEAKFNGVLGWNENEAGTLTDLSAEVLHAGRLVHGQRAVVPVRPRPRRADNVSPPDERAVDADAHVGAVLSC